MKRILFLVWLCAFPLFAELNGNALCNEVVQFFEANGFKVQENKIVSKTTNDFPTNLTVSFPQKNAEHTLIVNFSMRDAFNKKTKLLSLLENARSLQKKYSLVFLFSYGDEDDANVWGSKSFAENIEEPANFACLSISFTEKNRALIIPGGANKITPANLLKTTAQCLEKNNTLYQVQAGFAASLFRLGILQTEKRASSFLQNDIASVSLSFPNDVNFVAPLSDFLLSYHASEKKFWDSHYIFLQNGLHFFLLGERFIIIAFIVMSFVNLFSFIERAYKTKKIKFKNDILFYLFAVSVLNIFIFSAIDISLFFLFAFEFIIIYLSHFSTKIFGITFSFAIMSIPYVPFAKAILLFGSEKLFSTFTLSSIASLILLFFALLPFFLQIVRIFFLVFKNKKTKIKFISLVSLFIFANILFFGIFFLCAQFSFLTKQNKIITELKNDGKLFVAIDDEVFFGTTVRNISIDLGEEAISCEVSVHGVKEEAVLYSEDEYIVNASEKKSTFALPSFPPRRLHFSYTANTATRSFISVEALYKKSDTHFEKRHTTFIKDARQNRNKL